MKYRFIAAGAFTATIMAGVFISTQDRPALPEHLQHSKRYSNTAPQTLAADINATDLAKQQTSLRGTQVDRAIVTQKDGVIVLSPGILIYFDYFLSLEGEVSHHDLKQMAYKDIQTHYPPEIAKELQDLFRRYTDYLAAVSVRLDDLSYFDVLWQRLTPEKVEQELQGLFFSHEEIESLFTAYRQMLEYESEASQFSTRYAQYREIQAEQPSHSQAAATELFGSEAAARLQQLQQERAQWQQRLAHFQQEKQQLLSSGLSQTDQAQAIQALLEAEFTASEQIRVKALTQL